MSVVMGFGSFIFFIFFFVVRWTHFLDSNWNPKPFSTKEDNIIWGNFDEGIVSTQSLLRNQYVRNTPLTTTFFLKKKKKKGECKSPPTKKMHPVYRQYNEALYMCTCYHSHILAVKKNAVYGYSNENEC
jgi:hypothetical protein